MNNVILNLSNGISDKEMHQSYCQDWSEKLIFVCDDF